MDTLDSVIDILKEHANSKETVHVPIQYQGTFTREQRENALERALKASKKDRTTARKRDCIDSLLPF